MKDVNPVPIAKRDVDELIQMLRPQSIRKEHSRVWLTLSHDLQLDDRTIGKLLILNGLLRKQNKQCEICCSPKLFNNFQTLQMHRILSLHKDSKIR